MLDIPAGKYLFFAGYKTSGRFDCSVCNALTFVKWFLRAFEFGGADKKILGG